MPTEIGAVSQSFCQDQNPDEGQDQYLISEKFSKKILILWDTASTDARGVLISLLIL